MRGDWGVDMETVFEAYLPDGNVIKVFVDGSAEGFPHGTRVVNHFVRRYALCSALLEKGINAGKVSDHERASFGS
jgi:hypothetical protein